MVPKKAKRKSLRPYQAKAIENTMMELRKSSDPVLIEASVGAGKSLLCATLAEIMERNHRRFLCLTMTAELISQNAEEYAEFGYEPSIFCSTLNKKMFNRPCVFASPQSLWKAIQKGEPIADIQFSMLCIDEAHNVAGNRPDTVYMKIIAHYLALNPHMRIVGMTGTPFRDGNESIVGANVLFKKKTAEITLLELTKMGFLMPIVYGKVGTDEIDFSNVKANSRGNFKAADIEQALEGQGRLTAEIIADVVKHCAFRRGCFIFCATVQHCHEAAASLPSGTWAIVTGETPKKKRIKYMQDAKKGKIKYLLSVNCLMVGVNIPHYDTVAWLRPTESLILWMQGNGRAVRLSPATKKKECLVLEYAGNLGRHADMDDPIINEAVKYTPVGDPKLELGCPKCSAMNPVTARRCRGTHFNKATGKNDRCDFFFEFTQCQHCHAENDVTARNCRLCGGEVMNPNDKLKREASLGGVIEAPVVFCSFVKMEKNNRSFIMGRYLVQCTALGNPEVGEFVFPDAQGYPRHQFHQWRKEHCPHVDEAINGNTDEILAHRDGFLKPKAIKFRKKAGTQYYEVVEKIW